MPQTPDGIYQQCLANAQSLGGKLCDQDHCNNSLIANFVHSYCDCTGTFANLKFKNPYTGELVCPFDYATPAPVLQQNCYCCCGCFAYGTPIAFDKNQYKAVEEYIIGDKVWAADDLALTSWSYKTVEFSSGAGGKNPDNLLLMVVFQTTNEQFDYLLCSRDQLFLLSDNTLKTAARLVPGQDHLLMYDKQTAPVISLRVGHFPIGVHHIGTSTSITTDPSGHLIVAKGIVVGDYALQISQAFGAEPMGLTAAHDSLPSFDTPEYLTKYTHLVGSEAGVDIKVEPSTNMLATVRLTPSVNSLESLIADSGFVPLDQAKAVSIPTNVRHFLTDEQASDLVKNAPLLPLSAASPYILNYLFTFYNAFYPKVQFYYDANAQDPNAHSFRYAGVDFIIVNHGLIRLQDTTFDFLAFVIAHELGHLYGGKPQDSEMLSCTGQADYSAIAAILVSVFLGLRAVPVINAAITQLTKVFGYIEPAHQGGTSDDKCHDISLDCRMRSIQAAMLTLPLPSCAGGPPDPELTVDKATVTKVDDKFSVSIRFNIPVLNSSATAAGNYEFIPQLDTTGAQVDPNDGTVVIVTVNGVQPNTDYKVAAYNVLSILNQPLLQDKNTATFTYTEGK